VDQALAANLASIPEGLWLATEAPIESPAVSPVTCLLSILPALIILLFLVSTNKFTLWNDGGRPLVSCLSLVQSALELFKSVKTPMLYTQWMSLQALVTPQTSFAEVASVSSDFLGFTLREVARVPLIGFFAPALCFTLFAVTLFGPRFVVTQPPPPRSWIQTWKQHVTKQSNKVRRQTGCWILKGLEPIRLKGRDYLRPHHKSVADCPTNDARSQVVWTQPTSSPTFCTMTPQCFIIAIIDLQTRAVVIVAMQ